MADDTTLTPEEHDLLAAELALGVLDGELRAVALRLQMHDVQFRDAVAAWQTRFEPLFHAYAEVEAPDLWEGIAQRLPSIDGGQASADVARIKDRMRGWRLGALTTGAVAAVLAALLLFRAPTPVVPPVERQVAQAVPPAVARLGESDGAAQFVANYDAASGALQIRTVKLPQSDLAPELWIIPADNVPRSLGLIAASGSMRVDVSPALRMLLKDGVTLAVTLEKREGAPHKAPNSTPVAAGQIHQI